MDKMFFAMVPRIQSSKQPCLLWYTAKSEIIVVEKDSTVDVEIFVEETFHGLNFQEI